ncbi:unnamed protein product [Mycena citricolor]|uniref:Uncharacterized protein n=1 Tax=Mycena citricolor TaxID=2018698 RepID=A0AAD2Q2V3_9AGAR|nr:unnamed protein product [Mycena citricolor]
MPHALAKSMKKVAEHNNNFYFNGKKGVCGRKRTLLEEQITEAIDKLDSRELVDGKQVKCILFPNVPSFTVHHSHYSIALPNPSNSQVRDALTKAGLPGFAQRQKLPLTNKHLTQRRQIYKKFEAWTDPKFFKMGVMIVSDKTKMMLGSLDGQRC